MLLQQQESHGHTEYNRRGFADGHHEHSDHERRPGGIEQRQQVLLAEAVAQQPEQISARHVTESDEAQTVRSDIWVHPVVRQERRKMCAHGSYMESADKKACRQQHVALVMSCFVDCSANRCCRA